MPEKNYYEVLRITKSATQQDIDNQYHELLYQHHPDRNQGDEDQAVERTIQLVNAYRTLSDPEARKKYDFRVSHAPIAEALTKGIKLLKSREKKEAEARFAEGVAAFNQGELAKAAESFKAALKLEPAFPEASYNLALCGALLGNATFAMEAIARGLKASPEDPALLRLRKGVNAAFSAA